MWAHAQRQLGQFGRFLWSGQGAFFLLCVLPMVIVSIEDAGGFPYTMRIYNALFEILYALSVPLSILYFFIYGFRCQWYFALTPITIHLLSLIFSKSLLGVVFIWVLFFIDPELLPHHP